MPIDSKIESIITAIASDGFAIIPDFLPPAQIAALADEARQLQVAGEMRRAVTGSSNATTADNKMRGDFIHWLEDANASRVQKSYLQTMDTLREQLNLHFYLGLFELESHFAIYPTGAIYRKHLDQFQDKQHRQISCILYLNHAWQAEDGGQLRFYLNGRHEETYLDIEPIGSTLVVFLSDQFWHEVLPAKRQRISLTGWFRTRE
ncbi:MAG: 2OG-Fe(II) oxygenase [Methylophilaceae bacterium]|nr:2OG-Fe(II) oxygenase [Methylophilaceae bacterium]